jgi:hypothetical protein
MFKYGVVCAFKEFVFFFCGGQFQFIRTDIVYARSEANFVKKSN